MLKNIIFLSLVALLAFSCKKNKRVRLFELNYQNMEFEVPAGISSSQSLIFEFPELKTNFQAFLDQSGVEFSQIGGIYPLNARITAFDGNDYYYIQEVEIRVCASEETDCTHQVDGLFYAEQLNGNEDDRIDLASGLQNVKTLMSGQFFRLEVVLYLNFGQITPLDQLSRLEMSFEVTE